MAFAVIVAGHGASWPEVAVCLGRREEYSAAARLAEAAWTAYPEDHIGRLAGDAVAGATARPTALDLRRPPIRAWRLDAYELGANDLRSTKTNVIRDRVVLTFGSGSVGE